jgi:hypothetical protein
LVSWETATEALQIYLILDRSLETGLNRATIDLLFGKFWGFDLFYGCLDDKLDDCIVF